MKEPENSQITPQNIAAVEKYFTDNSKGHLRDASEELDISMTTIWRILRLELKWKPYKPLRVNMLTEKNKEDRVNFCKWYLDQEEDFGQRVIWSDEKWFVLQGAPNSKNDVTWVPWHPEEEEECRRQGDSKIMAWVALVDGVGLTVRWMTDESGRSVSVTADRYLSMIRDYVWPEVRHRSSRRHYWWQQDGATSHCTNLVLDFVGQKFRNRVISRRSPIPWPPYSPDLSPLDFFLWGWAESHVRRIKPSSISELKTAVEEVIGSVPEDFVRAAAANVRKRCEACLTASGGHFEYFLKSM